MSNPGGKARPSRPKFFAMKFIRLMVKECLAQEVGQTGILLLTVIATTEDAAGYRRSVSYTDEQLMPLLGVSSKSTISVVRHKCINAGWLHFEPGCRGKASRYWVTIPTISEGVDDYPTDEGHCGLDTINERIQNANRTNTERKPNANRTLLPIPDPLPHPHGDDEPPKGDKPRQRRKHQVSPLSQETALPEVVEGLAYTAEVVAEAWKVARLFDTKSPNPSRSVDTVQKIVRQFCDVIAGNKDAAQRLKDYYSLNDAGQWQSEVDAGLRLPAGAPAFNVCNLLFPRTTGRPIVPTNQSEPGTALADLARKRAEAEVAPMPAGFLKERLKKEVEIESVVS